MKRIFLIVLILILAFLLRFGNTPLRYGIGYDGSRDAIVAFESAQQFQLPLTGSFSSVAPVTFGPWYYYYITLANFVIPSIWAPWIVIGMASLAMVYVMYLIGSKIYNTRFGLLLALLTGISPAQIAASTALQQHALIGFLSSLAILFVVIIFSKEKISHGFSLLWGFVIGVAINTHFQALGLISLPLLAFIYKKKFSLLFFFIIGIIISFIPILTFELNNHWFNTKNSIDYILIGQYRIWTSNRWLTFLGNFFPGFWSYVTGFPFIISFVCMILAALILFGKTLRKKLQAPLFIVVISFIVLMILLRYYRGEKFFGYLQFFHPYVFIFTTLVFYYFIKLSKRLLIYVLTVLLFSLYLIPVFQQSILSDPLHTQTLERFRILERTFPQMKFSTYECNIYDTDRIQALTLYLYMFHKYDLNGKKISIYNQTCRYNDASQLTNDLVDISGFDNIQLKQSGLRLNSPEEIYKGTARWWFKEQP